MTTLSITEICHLFEQKGDRAYDGEPVTLVQHALQTAWLAQRAQASPMLIAACLLHDLGHLLNDQGENATGLGVDDQHEQHAARMLVGLFGAAVTEPIRLHVDAKRYLCYARPGYRDTLSQDSRRSLDLQGGVFSAPQAEAFMRLPHAEDAVNLRLWDDQAKLPDITTPSLPHFAVTLRTCVLRKTS